MNKKIKKIGFRAGVISTLGLTYFIAKMRSKKLIKGVEPQLKTGEKALFPINKLIQALGNKENIKNATSTLSSVNVVVDDMSKIKNKDLKSLKTDGIRTILKRANKLTIIFDDKAKDINKVITETINASESIEQIGGVARETIGKLSN